MLFFSVVGQLLLIISTFVAIGGLLMVTGTLGIGWGARFVGTALLLVAAGGFFGGKWATNQFAVQRRF
jgi:hypothetical protein